MTQAPPIETSIRFAQILLQEFGHEREIEFELEDLDFDKVRIMLEVAGYSVHRPRTSPYKVVAYRTDPDRAPVYTGRHTPSYPTGQLRQAS